MQADCNIILHKFYLSPIKHNLDKNDFKKEFLFSNED